MTIISLRRLRFHARHGVGELERVVGGDYEVSVRLRCHVDEALRSDRVEDTVNYAEVYAIVAREMSRPAALIEHVAYRIGRAIRAAFPGRVAAVRVTIAKLNPPMGTDGGEAEVEVEC